MSRLTKPDLKNEILLRIQKNFPLEAQPFKVIAKELNTTSTEVLTLLNEAKDEKIIRQTSAIFDTKKLGYSSSLVAFEIAEEQIDEAVKILNAHPGISHNYERNHTFNIWFTLAVAPNSKLGLEKTVEILALKTKAINYIVLPTLKLFKISVKLDTTNTQSQKEHVKTKVYNELTLNDFHYELIKHLQKDISFVEEPFKEIIEALNISYETLFEHIQEFLDAGVIRRYASILNHRNAGFNANAMVVWNINEENALEIGKEAASYSAVSHCYLRPKYPNWQYNLFTMIHGKTKEETQKVIDDIAQNIEHTSYMPLYSSREFKKVRISYFNEAFYEWEQKYI
ncbi:MAG: Lrp/AsnC family transcriptional regulator [Arcobacteraceae bacterium]